MAIRFDLLRQLAQHLKEGKLGHEIFDFSQYNNGSLGNCGTRGCAIGECPVLWPELWIFHKVHGDPVLIKQGENTRMSGMLFFGLSVDQYEHLFQPLSQDNESYGGDYLSGWASRYMVANNILAFCEELENENL